MAARFRIIILDRDTSNPALTIWRYVLWADVPVARQSFWGALWTIDNPSRPSAWAGASGADNLALQNGEVAEVVQTIERFPGDTMAVLQAALQQRSAEFITYVTNYNPWNRYGSTWDGTTWVVTTVA
jgi:hypothetical protein